MDVKSLWNHHLERHSRYLDRCPSAGTYVPDSPVYSAHSHFDYMQKSICTFSLKNPGAIIASCCPVFHTRNQEVSEPGPCTSLPICTLNTSDSVGHTPPYAFECQVL